MVRVYFESNGYAELVAVFQSEDVYMAALESLEKLAESSGMIITESLDSEIDFDDIDNIANDVSYCKEVLFDAGYITSGLFQRDDFICRLQTYEDENDVEYTEKQREFIITEAMKVMQDDNNFDAECGHTWDTIDYCISEQCEKLPRD